MPILTTTSQVVKEPDEFMSVTSYFNWCYKNKQYFTSERYQKYRADWIKSNPEKASKLY